MNAQAGLLAALQAAVQAADTPEAARRRIPAAPWIDTADPADREALAMAELAPDPADPAAFADPRRAHHAMYWGEGAASCIAGLLWDTPAARPRSFRAQVLPP